MSDFDKKVSDIAARIASGDGSSLYVILSDITRFASNNGVVRKEGGWFSQTSYDSSALQDTTPDQLSVDATIALQLMAGNQMNAEGKFPRLEGEPFVRALNLALQRAENAGIAKDVYDQHARRTEYVEVTREAIPAEVAQQAVNVAAPLKACSLAEIVSDSSNCTQNIRSRNIDSITR